MKLPISAIVVGYNEASQLKKCLPKLFFCDEILYFDLGSSDNSIEIANSFGAAIIQHERVDGVEWIHTGYYKKTKNEWVLITDPDEVISPQLIDDIFSLFKNGINERIGSITASLIYYFKDKKLLGTNWGGINRRVLLINNKRFEFLPLIHVSRQLLPGFIQYDIPYNGDNFIFHFWMESYQKLIEKHRRYLKHEGEARYKTGNITPIKQTLLNPYSAFKYSFIYKQGYKDGFKGFFLSIFWAWYDTTAKIKTLIYSRKHSNK